MGLGPGAAVGGMLPETNTGHSCYLTAARRRWFFSLVNLGPRGSGLQHTDRDKYWVQLLFDSGSTSPGAVSFPSGGCSRG